MTYSKLSASFLILILLLIIYSNSFQATWHFDDFPNIINNQRVHLTELNWDSFGNAIHGLKYQINRPLAYFSFGLNWYYGQNNVFGYHVVNFVIHSITGVLLFITLLNFFKTPRLKHILTQNAFFIALLSSVLWAAHPIQVQAVTYIVQRMASMGAMFYLFGIFFYLKGRLYDSSKKRVFFYICTFLAFIFALGSKQNTIVFPISLFFIELIFFDQFNLKQFKKYILPFILTSIFIGLIGIFIFLEGNPLHFLDGYERRGFTLGERLLTEPRILIFYLSQLFYPVVTRLSITHDFEISSSLLQPWTTLPAILFLLFMLVFACQQARKQPLVSFAIFFFLLNHCIESTFIPLELIFEHRNYLPSLFLFVPVVAGIKQGLNYYQDYKRSMYVIIVSSLVFFITFLGLGTYTRNMTWASEKSLWQDAIEKAPKSARPRQNLGTYYTNHNQLEKAYAINQQAISLSDPNPKNSESLSYFNIAGIHLLREEFQQAITYYQKALQIRPNYFKARYALAITHLKARNLKKAGQVFGNSAQVNINSITQYNNLIALIALKNGDYHKTITLCGQVIRKYPDNTKSLLYLGSAYKQKKQHDKARFFLNRALKFAPDDISVLFQSLENELVAKQFNKADRILDKILNKFSLPHIKTKFIDLVDNPIFPSLNKKLLTPAFAEKIHNAANSFKLPASYVEFFQKMDEYK